MKLSSLLRNENPEDHLERHDLRYYYGNPSGNMEIVCEYHYTSWSGEEESYLLVAFRHYFILYRIDPSFGIGNRRIVLSRPNDGDLGHFIDEVVDRFRPGREPSDDEVKRSIRVYRTGYPDIR